MNRSQPCQCSTPGIFLWLLCLLSVSCVDPVVINGTEDTTSGGDQGPSEEATSRLVEHALLIRVIPVDSSGDRGAEVFCAAVALQSNLLITTASCFQGGVRYAEVKRGPSVSFRDIEPRLGIVTQVYTHPVFTPGIPTNSGYDVAVVKISSSPEVAATIPIVELFEGDPSSLDQLLRVGYQRGENDLFQRVVSFGFGAQTIDAVLSFSVMTTSEAEPCLTSGGPVLALLDGNPQIIAISSRGDESCTQGGSASIVNASRDFIQDAYRGTLEVSEQNPDVVRDLSCAQYFLCYHFRECRDALTASAQQLIDNLLACALDQGCNEFSCYPDVCPTEYDLCVNPM